MLRQGAESFTKKIPGTKQVDCCNVVERGKRGPIWAVFSCLVRQSGGPFSVMAAAALLLFEPNNEFRNVINPKVPLGIFPFCASREPLVWSSSLGCGLWPLCPLRWEESWFSPPGATISSASSATAAAEAAAAATTWWCRRAAAAEAMVRSSQNSDGTIR